MLQEGRSKTYKLKDFGHLYLVENTTSNVVTKGRGIANGECVGSLHGYFSGLATIQPLHTLYFCEGHEIAVLEAVACFIETSY